MEVAECIEGRTSIRSFRADPVDDAVVKEALRMANLAPSAGNLQARDFIVVREARTKRALAEAAYGQDFVRTAPVVIVCCANLERIGHYGERGRNLYCLQDVAAALQNMTLYLHSKGLGSVWVGAFDEEKARIAVGAPMSLRPVALMPLGYPAEKGVHGRRLPLDSVTHWEKW